MVFGYGDGVYRSVDGGANADRNLGLWFKLLF